MTWTFVEWIATAVTVLAVALVSANRPGLSKWAFPLFILSNLAWAAIAIRSDLTGLLATQVILGALNVWGIMRWWRAPAE